MSLSNAETFEPTNAAILECNATVPTIKVYWRHFDILKIDESRLNFSFPKSLPKIDVFGRLSEYNTLQKKISSDVKKNYTYSNQ